MQSVSSRIWTRVAVSIFYDDNDYTTGTSIALVDSISLYIGDADIYWIVVTAQFV